MSLMFEKVKLNEGKMGKRHHLLQFFELVYDSEGGGKGFRGRKSIFSLKSMTFVLFVLIGVGGEVGLRPSRATRGYQNQGFLTNSTGKGLLLPWFLLA